MTTTKLSSAQRLEVLAEIPAVLRKLAAERDQYKNAWEAHTSRTRVEKLASSMLDKGIRTGDALSIADELEKMAANGEINLDVTEAAVDLHGTDMGKRAHVSDENSGSSGGSDLERYMLS